MSLLGSFEIEITDTSRVNSRGISRRNAMNSTDYGPVPVSRLKSERVNVLTALEGGRNVLLSRHGRVVAMLTPLEAHHDGLVRSLFTAGRPSVPVLTMTQIESGSPSAAVRRAEEGSDTLLADLKRNRVYGVLTAKPEPISDAEASVRADRIAQFLADDPEASADDLADFSEELDAEARTARRAHAEVAAFRQAVLTQTSLPDDRGAMAVELAGLLPEAITTGELGEQQVLAVAASLQAAGAALQARAGQAGDLFPVDAAHRPAPAH
ncbi:MAG: hypothetical protein ABIS35_12680 [Terracoccus sp.]